MNLVTYLFTIIVILIFNINIIYKLKNDKIDYRFALIWLSAGVVMLVFAIFPNLLVLVSDLLGIAIPLNLVFFLGVILSLYLTFTLMVSFTALQRKFTHLVQAYAILQHEVEAIRNSGDATVKNETQKEKE